MSAACHAGGGFGTCMSFCMICGCSFLHMLRMSRAPALGTVGALVHEINGEKEGGCCIFGSWGLVPSGYEHLVGRAYRLGTLYWRYD